MQCQRPTCRAVCRVGNAYNASLALRATFGFTAERANDNDRIPSAWEPAEWEELKTNGGSVPGQGQHGKEGTKTAPQAPVLGISKKPQWPRRRKEPLNADARTHTQSSQGENGAKQDVQDSMSRDRRMRERLLSQAAAQVRVGTADMSDPKYWHGQQYGNTVVDAEGWKNHIGNLVALCRQVQQDKHNRREISSQGREQLKMVFDYAPIAILPREPAAEIGAVSPAPWDLPPEDRREGAHLRGERLARYWLSLEISRFVEFMRPTLVERTARAAATKEVKRFINDSLTSTVSKDTGLEIHGSEQTGLAMSTSDIDIRIWATDSSTKRFDAYHYGRSMLRRMQPIWRALRSKPDLFGMVTLRGEGIHPIINFHHKPSGLDFQIVATESSKPQEETTRKYLAEIPNLDSLFIVVRTFFEVRGLLPVHNGGIGSYGCFVMLLPPLLRVRALSARGLSGMTTGGLLRRFLAFYSPSTTINPVKYGVSCFPRQRFKKHDANPQIGRFIASARRRGDLVRAGQWRLCQRNEYQPYLLAIQDPANPNNDLGSRMHAIKHILATIVRVREDLRQWAKRVSAVTEPARAYEPILTKIVGRPDLLYKHQRQVLEEYGRSVTGQGYVKSTSDVPREQEKQSGLPITKRPIDKKLVNYHRVGAPDKSREDVEVEADPLAAPENAAQVRKMTPTRGVRIRTHSIGGWH